MKSPLKMGQFEPDIVNPEGFRLLSCQDVFSEKSYKTLQAAFDDVPWVKKDTPFYTQFESFVQPTDGHALTQIYDPAFFFPFKAKLEKLLGVSFENHIRLAAHKLITADRIGVHNDYADPDLGYENFRFIFQFAKPDQLVSGGELSFLASRYTDEAIKTYPYSSNAGICFEINQRSFHCVAPVEGERHTLVMYLWEKGRKFHGTGFEVRPIS